MDQEIDLTATLAEASMPAIGQEVPDEVRDENALEKLARIDETRESFPGEHWLVLGAGLYLWYRTSKHESFLVRTFGSILATMLVARAATGRDGLAKVLRYTPMGRGISMKAPAVKVR